MRFDDNTIKELARHLPRERTEIILGAFLKKETMNQTEVIQSTGLSYAIAQRTILLLVGANFIRENAETYARATNYTLTENGRRAIELCSR
jgi:predicted transcriptional regulator